MIEKKCMSVAELANYLSIGRCRAYDLCKLPDFPSFRCGNKILIEIEALDLWIKNKREITLKGV